MKEPWQRRDPMRLVLEMREVRMARAVRPVRLRCWAVPSRRWAGSRARPRTGSRQPLKAGARRWWAESRSRTRLRTGSRHWMRADSCRGPGCDDQWCCRRWCCLLLLERSHGVGADRCWRGGRRRREPVGGGAGPVVGLAQGGKAHGGQGVSPQLAGGALIAVGPGAGGDGVQGRIQEEGVHGGHEHAHLMDALPGGGG